MAIRINKNNKTIIFLLSIPDIHVEEVYLGLYANPAKQTDNR